MFGRISSFGAHGARLFAAYSSRSFSTLSQRRPLSSPSLFSSSSVMKIAIGTTMAMYGIHQLYDNKSAFAAESSVPIEGVYGTNSERTFIALKPDAVQRGLIGKIIARFEEKGYKLVALKLIHPSRSQAEGHYSDLKTKPFFSGLVNYFSSGAIVAMVWEGKGVIAGGRKLLGETDPAKSAPGSIRGDYSIEVGRNIIHGSDGADSAADEIKFWFSDKEVINWTAADAKWIYEKP